MKNLTIAQLTHHFENFDSLTELARLSTYTSCFELVQVDDRLLIAEYHNSTSDCIVNDSAHVFSKVNLIQGFDITEDVQPIDNDEYMTQEMKFFTRFVASQF